MKLVVSPRCGSAMEKMTAGMDQMKPDVVGVAFLYNYDVSHNQLCGMCILY